MRQWTILAGTIILLAIPQMAHTQTGADIEGIVSKSKLVDASHPVRAMISSNQEQVSISTFCHQKTTDRDCKITALLMMKELMQHYKTIRGIRVTFFDEVNNGRSRTAHITKEDALLVDSGRPVQEVLSLIDISYGSVSSRMNADSVKPLPNAFGLHGLSIVSRKTIARRPIKASSSTSKESNPDLTPVMGALSGLWTSDLGQVTITQYAGTRVTGYWDQGESENGTFTGSYDAGTHILEISFYQPWSDTTGAARFELSSDGKDLIGNWRVGRETERWNMHR